MTPRDGWRSGELLRSHQRGDGFTFVYRVDSFLRNTTTRPFIQKTLSSSCHATPSPARRHLPQNRGLFSRRQHSKVIDQRHPGRTGPGTQGTQQLTFTYGYRISSMTCPRPGPNPSLIRNVTWNKRSRSPGCLPLAVYSLQCTKTRRTQARSAMPHQDDNDAVFRAIDDQTG